MLPCQHVQLSKKHLLYSLLLHLGVLFLFSILSTIYRPHRKFTVFGVPTAKKKVSQAYFRLIKAPTSSYNQAQTKKPVSKKPISKKPVSKKPISKSTITKKPAPKKPALKKPVPKQLVAKKPVLKNPALKKPAPTQPVAEKPGHKQLTSNANTEQVLTLDERYVKYQAEVQAEILRVWHPPVGVPKESECELLVFVADNGTIEKFEMKKKSKVLVYDLSVMQAVREFKFSSFLRNSSLVITFRQ